MSKTDYRNHTCGECRMYVPRNTEFIPEYLVGRYKEGHCKPWKNGPAELSCQREAQACQNFRKRRKPPVGKKVCACRECKYNNPTPDGHWCAFLGDYMAPCECSSFCPKDYDHDTAISARYRKKWDDMNAL